MVVIHLFFTFQAVFTRIFYVFFTIFTPFSNCRPYQKKSFPVKCFSNFLFFTFLMHPPYFVHPDVFIYCFLFYYSLFICTIYRIIVYIAIIFYHFFPNLSSTYCTSPHIMLYLKIIIQKNVFHFRKEEVYT